MIWTKFRWITSSAGLAAINIAIDRHLLILAISFPGVEWRSGVPGLQVVTQLWWASETLPGSYWPMDDRFKLNDLKISTAVGDSLCSTLHQQKNITWSWTKTINLIWSGANGIKSENRVGRSKWRLAVSYPRLAGLWASNGARVRVQAFSGANHSDWNEKVLCRVSVDQSVSGEIARCVWRVFFIWWLTTYDFWMSYGNISETQISFHH